MQYAYTYLHKILHSTCMCIEKIFFTFVLLYDFIYSYKHMSKKNIHICITVINLMHFLLLGALS